MTPPHIWESIIVHSAILFTPIGKTIHSDRKHKALSQESPSHSRTVCLLGQRSKLHCSNRRRLMEVGRLRTTRVR